MSKEQVDQTFSAEQRDDRPLAERIVEEGCPLCWGAGVVDDEGTEIVCPACQQQPAETPAMALACAVAGVDGGNGRTTAPALTSPSTQPTAFGGAEECCPNCHGKRYFTEKVMNDEGKPITTQVRCERCNGKGYIVIPLYSPVLAQEKAMISKWPTEEFEINWPWVGEPDPVVGTIVGWNWDTEEVAVITKQPQFLNMKPWKVTIELRPMSERLLRCIVIGVDEPVVHKDVNWYATWTRTGEQDLLDTDTTASFFGRCVVKELV